MEGGLLFSVQLFAENESVCVCVQLCPVNAGVQWLYYENVRFKCMCVSDFVSRLPFCIAVVAMSVLLIHSQYLYVLVYSPERTKQLRTMLEQYVLNNK